MTKDQKIAELTKELRKAVASLASIYRDQLEGTVYWKQAEAELIRLNGVLAHYEKTAKKEGA